MTDPAISAPNKNTFWNLVLSWPLDGANRLPPTFNKLALNRPPKLAPVMLSCPPTFVSVKSTSLKSALFWLSEFMSR